MKSQITYKILNFNDKNLNNRIYKPNSVSKESLEELKEKNDIVDYKIIDKHIEVTIEISEELEKKIINNENNLGRKI